MKLLLQHHLTVSRRKEKLIENHEVMVSVLNSYRLMLLKDRKESSGLWTEEAKHALLQDIQQLEEAAESRMADAVAGLEPGKRQPLAGSPEIEVQGMPKLSAQDEEQAQNAIVTKLALVVDLAGRVAEAAGRG